MELLGRAAIVTGGAVRIGRAITLELAAAGVDVFIHYNRSAAPAEEVAERARELGVRAEIGSLDLSEPGKAGDLVARATAAVGTVSLLVNSASGFPRDTFSDVDLDGWRQVHDLTLASPMMLTQAFAAALSSDASGAVVNVADVKTRRPYRKHFSYIVAKGGLDTLTRAAALALAPRIRVNAVALGVILPPPGEGEDYVAKLAADLPLKRAGGATPVAEAVLFLLRNDFVTGETVRLDGGAHLV